RDELAIMAAFLEQVLRMGLLEIEAADLARGDMRRDAEHRHARAVAVEQPVDEVKVARSAAAGTDRKFAAQMRLGAARERARRPLTPMPPSDLPLPADRVGQAVEAVADNAVNPFDAGRGECFGELIGHGFHVPAPLARVGELAPLTPELFLAVERFIPSPASI